MRLLHLPARAQTYFAPSDRLGRSIADLVMNPTEARERLCRYVYKTVEPGNPLGLLQEALDACADAEPLEKRIRVDGVKTGRVTALDLPGQIQQALAAGHPHRNGSGICCAITIARSWTSSTSMTSPRTSWPPKRSRSRARRNLSAWLAESGGSLARLAAKTPADAGAPGVPAAPAGVPVPAHLAPSGWLLYQIDIELDPAIAGEFDAWLPAHVDDVLRVSGFAHADILVRDEVADGARKGWQRRSVHYRVREKSQLDSYLDEHAAAMRAQTVERFGEHATFERRTLTQSAHRTPGEVKLEYCQNCGALLAGQYCAACGQRARVRIISLWHLIREAVGDLTHLDSRLWRTMGPLLFKPGLLTNEYLAGRRARYIPPFRLYLGLSIIFFVLASFGDDPLAIDTRDMTPEDRAEIQRQVDEGKADALRALSERGVEVPDAKPAPAQTPEATTPAQQPADGSQPRVLPEEERQATFNQACERLVLDLNIPGREAAEQRMRRACQQVSADNGMSFGRALLDNVPKMMFVFLPLLALANKGLYPFSRRYYVEHLLFFVHFHAFVFLLFSLKEVFDGITSTFAAGEVLSGLLLAVIVFYLPIYLYKAMRKVFGQGRLATMFKFSLLFIAYNICLVLTLMGMVIYVMLTM